ncbi:MAG: Uncharacterized protein LiPW30_738 [Parcubacteria group bacterium LiPW_30]|nr:MAG: Uncharacterized protein LiPW30_738 [Parcubacteria group bacterium LiPW_30]
MKKLYIFFSATVISIALLGFVSTANFASAYIIEDLNFQNEGDIVVGPGKTEVLLSPGDNYTREILISNRSGAKKLFTIKVEDFRGSEDPGATVEFLGTEKGPYSLKDYVKPEIGEIILNHGQRLRLPVTISIPQDAEPGGLYGAVMISASNIDEGDAKIEKDTVGTKMKIITRIASLLFVKIKGDVFQEGVLKGFETSKDFYEKGPIPFKLLFENTGNIHLSPYGAIEVKNILGAKVGEAQVDPWFVMPKSERTREIKWNSNFLFGRYTALLTLNRGYDDIIDTKEFSFWVIPWKIVLIGIIGLILLLWLFIWLVTHLEFKKKRDNNANIPPQSPNIPPPVLQNPSIK